MAAFGVFMALFSRSPLSDGFNQQIDPVFSLSVVPCSARDDIEGPSAAIVSSARGFQGWALGVSGATVAGFGVLAAIESHVGRQLARLPGRWSNGFSGRSLTSSS
jgi:hypothetical protein